MAPRWRMDLRSFAAREAVGDNEHNDQRYLEAVLEETQTR